MTQQHPVAPVRVADLAETAHRRLVHVAVFAFGWMTGTAMCGLIVIGWW